MYHILKQHAYSQAYLAMICLLKQSVKGGGKHTSLFVHPGAHTTQSSLDSEKLAGGGAHAFVISALRSEEQEDKEFKVIHIQAL